VFSNRREVRVYLSNGAAAPTLFAALLYPVSVYGVALADFDLDGHFDLAVNADGTLQIRRFDFVAGTAPVVSEFVTSYSPAGRLVAAELTGDATPDLLVGGTRIYPSRRERSRHRRSSQRAGPSIRRLPSATTSATSTATAISTW
jgi:hypothetical protein